MPRLPVTAASDRWLLLACLIPCTLVVLFLLTHAWHNLNYNIDTAFYQGVVLRFEGVPAEQVAQQVDESLRAGLDADDYAKTMDHPLGRHVLDHPLDFDAQLNFYRVKPLHTTCLCLLHKTGMPLLDAVRMVNMLSAALIYTLQFAWLAMYLHPR